MNNQQPINNIMHWLKESVTIKLCLIIVLTLILLIPSSMIGGLISERASRQDDTIKAVSDQYSGSQLIQGPVLVIPFKHQVLTTDTNGRQKSHEAIHKLYVLPNTLTYNSKVMSDVLHRGIYEVSVYNTDVAVAGDFLLADIQSALSPGDELMPDKAEMLLGISDLKGIKTNPIIKTTGQSITVVPAPSDSLFPNSLKAPINFGGKLPDKIPFSTTLNLKGSEELQFLHTGRTTVVDVDGNWGTPSFDGRYLPDQRQLGKNSFKAHWQALYYNRPYPQQWIDDTGMLTNPKKIGDATFGVWLRQPVDQYQKTMRTSKYAFLIILLAFISLFLTEMVSKQRVHIFNYVLIGAAMVIYYTLLLSFSEQVGYNIAYLIASIATIALISIFLASVLGNRKAAGVFAIILSTFYGFIYVIIQLEDLSLLIGSIALFIIVAVLMYCSRKINWDRNDLENELEEVTPAV